jgi:hypothetical protein
MRIYCAIAALIVASCSTDPAPGSSSPDVTAAAPTPLAASFGLAVPHFSHARPADVRLRREAGIRWVRRDISWNQVEPERGVFDFTRADEVIDAELAEGMRILVILDYGNALYAEATDDDDHFPPDDVADFGRYVTATVEHFRGRVHAWEIWNEPNIFVFWKPTPNAAAYAELLIEGAARVREADPETPLLLGGLLGNVDPIFYGQEWGFLSEVLEAVPALLDLVDVLSIHPYTYLQTTEPEVSSGVEGSLQIGFSEMFHEMRAIAAEHGHPDIPIWVTEMGWHTAIESVGSVGVSETMHAALMVRACVLAIALEAAVIMPFTYSDGPNDLTDKESHFGLVRYDPELREDETAALKPAYTAYRLMTEMLGPTAFTRDLREVLRLAPTVYAYEFKSVAEDEWVVVAWSTAEGDAIEMSATAVRSLLGDSVSTPSVTVALGPQPLYLLRNSDQF